MKTTLNNIISKLADYELSKLDNSIINEQAELNLWQKIKNSLNKKKSEFDEVPVDTKYGTVISNVPTAVAYRLNAPLANADINSNFGWRGVKRHKGVDFAVPSGTPVYAVRQGKVERIGVDPDGWGDYVVIKHEEISTPNGFIGETFYSLYAHLSKVLVTQSENVTGGMLIGNSGGEDGAPGAGNSTGPHLHFEIQLSLLDGQVDPRKFYAKYKSKLENASIPNANTNNNRVDNIKSTNQSNDNNTSNIGITDDQSIVSSTSDISTDEVQAGITKKDGFILYSIPGDRKWVYGIPDVGSSRTYGWWALVPNTDKWVNLQSKLSPAKYKEATTLLNKTWPTALTSIDVDNTPEITNVDDETNTDSNTVDTTKTVSLLSRFKPKTVYKPTNIFKKDDVRLYVYENGKFIPEYTKATGIPIERWTLTSKYNIKYLGHDKSSKFVHVHIYTYDSNDDKKFFDYWININDIKLKK
jgi:murein DD-endopeptidase MepM/ murein hydrolase activator NlpD